MRADPRYGEAAAERAARHVGGVGRAQGVARDDARGVHVRAQRGHCRVLARLAGAVPPQQRHWGMHSRFAIAIIFNI